MTRAEISHALFGVGLAVTGLAALRGWRKPDSPVRCLWPVPLLVVSFNLLVPAESPIDLGEPVGLWETLTDLYPVDLGAWLAGLEHFHIVQHRVTALLGLLAGGVELARGADLIGPRKWGFLLPLGSVAAGLLLGFHGLGEEHIVHMEQRIHHTIFAVCFVTGGVALGLYRTGRVAHVLWRDAWAVLVVLAGLDFAFFYRIG